MEQFNATKPSYVTLYKYEDLQYMKKAVSISALFFTYQLRFIFDHIQKETVPKSVAFSLSGSTLSVQNNS